MLLRLPQELLLQIHLYALNPFFPQTHPVVQSAISSPTPTYAALYLLTLYQDYGAADILVRSLRHPICNTSVAREIRRIWDKRRGYVAPRIAVATSSSSSSAGVNEKATGSTHSQSSTSTSQPTASRERAQTPQPTAPALACAELPRRLFRHPKSDTIDPLLTYLFESYSPSANSHKGYPLCRAVLSSNYPMIEVLLHHGADPGLRSHLALETAIKRQDLRAVKMLVERQEDDLPYDDIKGRTEGRERRRKKRRRMSDRVNITPRLMQLALEEGSQETVNYFVEEKGIVPPLRGILSLTTPSKSKRKRPLADVFGAPRYA